VTQNVDNTLDAITDLKVKVSRQEGRYLWLSDAKGKTAILVIN
jgi:hypothetical protein